MEKKNILETKIGTKEMVTLKPARVNILDIKIETVTFGKDTKDKVIFICNHPAKEEAISISSAISLSKGKLKHTGLWVSYDVDGNIQKGSILSTLLNYLNAETLKGSIGKDIDTVLDEKGYQAFKCY